MRLLLKAFGVFLMLVVFSYAFPALGSDTFEVSLTLPASVTPLNSFPVTIQVKKRPLPGYLPPVYPETTLRRIAVAYVPNDNLSFEGPFEIWQGTLTWSGPPRRFPLQLIANIYGSPHEQYHSFGSYYLG